MRLLAWLACIGCAVALLCGCGGAGTAPDAPNVVPPPDDDPLQVGPLLLRTAAASNLSVDTIPSTGDASFVALHGATIDYAAVQAMLDRIVFTTYKNATFDVWRCDLFGEDLVNLTSKAATCSFPAWSPDGSRIAYTQAAGDAEIAIMDADGGAVQVITNNSCLDAHPAWSPDGQRLAFQTDRDGNSEIYAMYIDGTREVNLTNHSSEDTCPDWSPDRTRSEIVWQSDRSGRWGIYKMDQFGGNWGMFFNSPEDDEYPVWSPCGGFIAFQTYRLHTYDIWETDVDGGDRGQLVGDPGHQYTPAYSSDGSLIAFCSDQSGWADIWLKQTQPPYRSYEVTHRAAPDQVPDLGSPTMQIARVLIGPTGADHGYDPLWSYASAAVAAFNADGYLGFVRIGIRPPDLSSLQVTPLDGTGNQLVAVRLECNQIVNLREDAGLGAAPTRWDLDAQDATNAVLYLDANTGKLVSVLLTRDTSYPAAAGAADLAHSLNGLRTQVTGDFAAVYDDQGALVAEDVGAVEFDGVRLMRAF